MNELPATRSPHEGHAPLPCRRLLWCSALGFAALSTWAWFGGEIAIHSFFAPHRMENLDRFLRTEAVPFPLRGVDADASDWMGWASEQWHAGGGTATWTTLWIAIAAMALASLTALLLAPCAARTIAARTPFMDPEGPLGAWPWLAGGMRILFILARALPEYMLAFFLVAVLPGSAWPAVLALALHNGGILGRLFADTFENLERQPLSALRALGGTRSQITALAGLPLALPRFLLYFFYRFETCVREATVLGMLGIVSLGYRINAARSNHFYDELLLLVGFGVVLVLLADLSSHVVRAWLRRESPQ